MSAPRTTPAPVKLVCLGLGRTGTTSLRVALERLGFGPSYCMSGILRTEGKDFPVWFDIGNGIDIHNKFDQLFRTYPVIADYPAVMYAEELYAAYPDAKYILTTRDPTTWEDSMKSTILRVPEMLRVKKVKTDSENLLMEWLETHMLQGYHRGRLYTQARQEILDHEGRVKETIPSEKLLVMNVNEGWDKLVTFLGVSKPSEPFPHVNLTADFEAGLLRRLME